MKPWNNPKWVSRTPLVTTFFLEYANVGQLWRMWREHTAAGQNVWSWVSVWVALWLFLNFYRVCCPKERFAFWATVSGICFNTAVIATVMYFRLGGH